MSHYLSLLVATCGYLPLLAATCLRIACTTYSLHGLSQRPGACAGAAASRLAARAAAAGRYNLGRCNLAALDITAARAAGRIRRCDVPRCDLRRCDLPRCRHQECSVVHRGCRLVAPRIHLSSCFGAMVASFRHAPLHQRRCRRRRVLDLNPHIVNGGAALASEDEHTDVPPAQQQRENEGDESV